MMTYLVAEIGVNWEGDLDLLSEMVKNTKKIGFDAIKFQAFNEDIVKEHPEKDRLLRTAISKENIEDINEIAKQSSIEWFCTPMYLEAVELLEPYVNKFKIREFDARKLAINKITKLVEKIFATKKDIIASSQHIPKKIENFNQNKISWLYCIPKYPCELEDLDFRTINKFDGYSNHCTNIIAPLTSVILGSKILELHVTQSKNENHIDNNVSFEFNELQGLIKSIRELELIKK